MIRGELWTVAGGVYASKPRPALILQDDVFSGTDSVTVLPLTTKLVDAPLLRIRIPKGDINGLERDSDVMVDKMTIVRRQNVTARVGRLTASELAEIERSSMVFLGLAR
ncbi:MULTISPECIES: type II toxin-antitoxin system PemK/MazF family toxin [unclassified Microbacterium]|uniref:type II toxin-antitoxin system PemK/MazF family toxin n=1 Tax=unclassified Microbacterium TaxID=2609290 RepID=UPI000EAA397F|nr:MULTISPECIES: type II toxin-antitoxin system PemK/MazF family toxin [unclassified Microbacterium]MBT2483955.1 type II toxin-antitoxin system PemK/MazF family toxin [Microbacterium sp. ISL-108]RKN66922.1 type II toxin-antitoxin system PemK/MazF family toxin [Microbacterium sp. CGR2]